MCLNEKYIIKMVNTPNNVSTIISEDQFDIIKLLANKSKDSSLNTVYIINDLKFTVERTLSYKKFYDGVGRINIQPPRIEIQYI